MDQPSLYDDDIVTWAEQQASTLRELARRPDLSNILDWENVAEEIESVGRSQIQAVESLLAQTLGHLLKRLSAPDTLVVEHWRNEAGTFQIAAPARYERSMRQRLDWDKIWTLAQAQARLGLTTYGDSLLPHLPPRYPLGPDELLVTPFDVDAALRTIAESTILKSASKS
ncbi:DUF29 domain-containing protein [Methylobacterium sp. 37f]|uniref:DUF29 domain-containing protein n=1 Tax=Methylobacterium sp. 37f TaxID=2817058 RepID=UPI001FFD3C3B|nr:DUF29 domain-containing protein [Methylobacterium sp. 37f]MCK2052603.1 DUF29 domain-containing protein [Methylobacterium sp. 37f]